MPSAKVHSGSGMSVDEQPNAPEARPLVNVASSLRLFIPLTLLTISSGRAVGVTVGLAGACARHCSHFLIHLQREQVAPWQKLIGARQLADRRLGEGGGGAGRLIARVSIAVCGSL